MLERKECIECPSFRLRNILFGALLAEFMGQIRELSLQQKIRLLKEYTEDDFRDKVVRPLFQRKGFKHGSDLCGRDEAGKDCYFLTHDKFGETTLTAVQTKVGNFNLGAKPAQNLIAAITQLKTALDTSISVPNSKSKLFPSDG